MSTDKPKSIVQQYVQEQLAKELRRLSASEAALLEALEYIVVAWVDGMGSEWNQSNSASKARALIARTKEARNG